MLPNNIPAIRKSRGISQTVLADKIGTTLNMVGKLERGDRKLTSDWLSKIADALSVEPAELIGRSGTGTALVAAKPAPPAPDNIVSLRQIDLGLSMGDGTNLDDYIEEGTVDFDLGWVQAYTRAPAHRVILGRGVGDSMEPTLANNDAVLIDTTQTVLNQMDRIWAVSIYGDGGIKRLRKASASEIEVLSDNPRIGSRVVPADDVRIIGRVVGLARKL